MVFGGAFVGLALSSAWYLLARRPKSAEHRLPTTVVSVVVTIVFGVLWATVV